MHLQNKFCNFVQVILYIIPPVFYCALCIYRRSKAWLSLLCDLIPSHRSGLNPHDWCTFLPWYINNYCIAAHLMANLMVSIYGKIFFFVIVTVFSCCDVTFFGSLDYRGLRLGPRVEGPAGSRAKGPAGAATTRTSSRRRGRGRADGDSLCRWLTARRPLITINYGFNWQRPRRWLTRHRLDNDNRLTLVEWLWSILWKKLLWLSVCPLVDYNNFRIIEAIHLRFVSASGNVLHNNTGLINIARIYDTKKFNSILFVKMAGTNTWQYKVFRNCRFLLKNYEDLE